jgi:hypothetical protein
VITTKAKKKDVIPSAPYPTKAEMDYNQNGLVLPKDPKNLELLLRDVHQKGFLDLELLYQLKQKEEVKRVEKEIADRIENPLEEGTPLFQRVFERCLSSEKLILWGSGREWITSEYSRQLCWDLHRALYRGWITAP